MALTISKKKKSMQLSMHKGRAVEKRKVPDKYCPSVSDDLRRKILYRTYLSHQKGSCIEKTPSCDPVFSPGPACIIQHKTPSGVFPNRILGIWGVVRPGTTVGAKKGEHTHSLRGLLLVREPGPPELPAFADLPHEPSSGACHADQPLDSDCALGHQELVLIDLLAALFFVAVVEDRGPEDADAVAGERGLELLEAFVLELDLEGVQDLVLELRTVGDDGCGAVSFGGDV